MADSPMRQEAIRLMSEVGKGWPMTGMWQLKQAPMVTAAILDLADAVRELARKR